VFGTRWIDFEDRYIIRGGFQNYSIVGYRHLPELEKKISDNSFRITKAEAFELPEQVDVEVPVTLNMKARAIYDKLRREAIAEVEGLQGRGIALSRIVLTNVIRLQQVASGFVKVEDGRILDFDTAKADALADLLRDALVAAGRVVVFCRFRHDVDAAIAVSRRLVGDAVYRIDGTVDIKDREAQLAWFRTFEPSILVGQIQVASLAIDLTCAHVGVFFSRDYSLLNFDQARGRLHRHGQKSKVTCYHLIAENTIDEKILAALRKKDELQRKLLDTRRAKEFFS
jgi:SNF2 family DNA or RNA helicase